MVANDDRCEWCGAKSRRSPIALGSWLLTFLALTGALFFAVTQVQRLAEQRGRDEAAADAEPKEPKRGRVEIAPLIPVASSTVATVPGAVPATRSAPKPSVLAFTVVASATSNTAQNGCGQTVSYQASLVADGTADTAWRVPGDGRGRTLTMTLAGSTTLSSVGLVPGYDKLDQCTNADRFLQTRRITEGRWSFDDGTSVVQAFTESRGLQVLAVSTTTTRVVFEVLATTAAPELDFTAVSELRLFGVVG